jgi:hypothetical protein
MSELAIHIGLFLIVSLAIVGMGSCYSDAADEPALRNFPRRYLMFVAGCSVLALVMLILEHTIASVD